MAKILLADDSAHAQRMGTKILSAEGHEVTTVSNGQAALKTLKDSIPDLIVADVFMPGKTGYEVCQFIKSDPKLSRIPVVLIVAPMEPYDSTEGQRVKADSLVTKPLESSNLVAIVEQLLAAAKKSAPAAESKAAPEPAPEPEVPQDFPLTITTQIHLEIPEEIRQQPVSLIGELLEPQAAPAAAESVVDDVAGLAAEAPSSYEVGVAETVPEEPPVAPAAEPLLAASESESTGVGGALAAMFGAAGGEESARSEMLIPALTIQAPAPAPPSWTAEPAAVTEDDKKLFDPPPPDWQGLMSIVEEADESPQQPAMQAPASGKKKSRPAVESAAELSAAPAAPPESESPTAQTPPGPEGPSISEPTEGVVSSPSLKGNSDSRTDSAELPAPTIAPLDYATVEQIVRETVEELMPEIVDRIAKATGISFEKKG